ncbi:MAG TPA: hypothetical protein VK463_09795 [Desulfomonilaceae bacterium]|nr:hypothetical protein [Desulfomonilaceae bacterium]
MEHRKKIAAESPRSQNAECFEPIIGGKALPAGGTMIASLLSIVVQRVMMNNPFAIPMADKHSRVKDFLRREIVPAGFKTHELAR